MPTYTFPTNAELMEIEQEKLPNLEADRMIFQLLPIVNLESAILVWEQMDNFTGLMQARGYNGEPPRVTPVGAKRYIMEPGVYGEFSVLDELEMTIRRQYGTYATRIDVTDLVMERQDQILGRQYDRIEQIGWNLLATGAFTVLDAKGSLVHADTFPLQTFTAAVPWATVATATPLNDLRSVQLLGRGRSVDLGGRARGYLNRKTLNYLLNNTNANDVAGRRTGGFGTFNSIEQMNQLFTMDDLPNLVPYDNGYLDDTGTFTPFIPDNTVVVVGVRAGNVPVGNWVYTFNINNGDGAPRPYSKIIDRGGDEVPRKIEVHRGFNGGPTLKYGSAIVIMKV